MILLHGIPDVIMVRKTFASVKLATQWEDTVISRMHMIYDDRFLNRCNSKAIHPIDCGKHNKGRTYEEIYGVERAAELRAMRSASNKSRVIIKDGSKIHGNLSGAWDANIPRTAEVKAKISIAHINNHMKNTEQ